MRNHIRLGRVSVRIGSKHLAPWGFPRLRVFGLSFWTWTNSGQLCLAGYHPRSSITWLWSLWVDPRKPWRWTLHRQEKVAWPKSDREAEK